MQLLQVQALKGFEQVAGILVGRKSVLVVEEVIRDYGDADSERNGVES